MLKWCKESSGTPQKVAVVHGEENSAKAFAKTLKEEFNWNTFCPEYLEKIEI